MAKKTEDKFTEAITARVSPKTKERFLAIVHATRDKNESTALRDAVDEFIESRERAALEKKTSGNHPVPGPSPSGKLRRSA